MMAIETLTATTLRNIIGDLELDETLTRDTINTQMRIILDELLIRGELRLIVWRLRISSLRRIFRTPWKSR